MQCSRTSCIDVKKIRLRPIVWLGLILAGVGVCYWEVLSNGWVWDDRILILDQPGFSSWERFRELLSNSDDRVPVNYYRPLTAIQIFFELQVGKRDPALLHAVSLLVHLANIAMVFLLARLLSARLGALSRDSVRGRAVPWLAAAIYGIHPALIESVSWFAAQSDLMVTFYLLACLALSIDRITALRLVGLALLFFCAGLSKESAIVLPLVLLIIDAFEMCRRQRPAQACLLERYRTYVAVFLGGSGVLVVRYLGTGYLWVSVEHPLPTGTSLQHALLVGQTLFAYLHAGLFPFDTINPFHPVSLPVNVADALPWTQSLAALAVFGALVLGMNRGSLWALMGMLYVVALLPVLQIIPLQATADFYHDRYLTFPLVFLALGAAILVAGSVAKLAFDTRRAWGVRTVVACWIAAAGASVLVTVPLWRSDVTFWNWVVKRNPGAFMAEANLATAYLEAGRHEESLALNRELLRRYPGHYLPLINLGAQAVMEHRLEEGIGYMEQAIQSPYGIPKEAYARVLGNLGPAEAARGNLDLAETLLSEAVNISPGMVKAMATLSQVRQLKGDKAGADATWAQTLSLVAPEERAGFAAAADRNMARLAEGLRRATPSPGAANANNAAHAR